uniref:hypothetical protein Ycf80 n=1 Tax=Lophurella hookeriana TaxID=2509022 RepID=UPI002551FFC8|nr:hypothetical protein Ycf80 [Lophurella hookeriana]WGH13313.1 hypothetical protein Ycf80 [Lophurella hookeriana]
MYNVLFINEILFFVTSVINICCNIFYYYIFLFILNYYLWLNLMILFNFILLYKLGQNYIKTQEFCQQQFKRESRDTINQHSKKFFNKVFISKTNFDNIEVSYNLFARKIENKNLLFRNFWQKLINKYLQETIFLSPSNALSNNYILKLKISGLSVYKNNEYKNFLYKFSKDLLSGKVNVVTNDIYNSTTLIPVKKDDIYLKYKWLKLLNFKNFIFSNLKKDVGNIFRNSTSKLFNFSLPLFVIINDNQEIVVSESVDQLSKSRFFLNRFSYLINSNEQSKNLYVGLLFVNPQDATEYTNYIKANCYNSTLSSNINVVPANMQLYYKLMMLRTKNIEFRLIPDLTEISDCISKYKKYTNVSFNIKQKYSNNSFQGQPIYLIKPMYVKKKYSNYVKKLDYLYSFKKDQINVQYEAAFLNYKTLIGAWKKFKQNNSDYDLPSAPDVYVSNFEAFIQEKNYKKNYSNIIFLPSLQTYNFIQKYSYTSLAHTSGLKFWLLNKSVFLKTFVIRVFWSLTSRQPTNW